MSTELPTTEISVLTPSTTDLPTTDLTTLKTSSEQNDESDFPQTTIARIFTQANLQMTHTQHGIGTNLEKEVANLTKRVTSSRDLAINTHTQNTQNTQNTTPPTKENDTTTGINSATTMMNIDRGENEVTIAIHSKQKKICSFMPRKCNCSDRLTMQKTKFVLYIFPFFLLIACFYVLLAQQHVSTITFLLVLAVLISSFISAWICVLAVLFLFEIILVIRDAIFWCMVNKWNLEHKKAFIQAYSGVDLMAELDEQEEQLHTLRMLYVQQMRAHQELALIQQSTNRAVNDDEAGDTCDTGDTGDEEADYDTDNEQIITNIRTHTHTLTQTHEHEHEHTPHFENIMSNSTVNSPHSNSNRNNNNNRVTESGQEVINDILDGMEQEMNMDTDDEQSITELAGHLQTDTVVVHADERKVNLNKITPLSTARSTNYEEKKDYTPSHGITDSISVDTMIKKDSLKITSTNINTDKLHIFISDNHGTPSLSTNTHSNSNSSPYTPIPTSAKPDGDNIIMLQPQQQNTANQKLRQIADNAPYGATAEAVELSFDDEEDLNTPENDNNEALESWDMDLDLDGSTFNIWGTTPEERDAFLYISNSCSANVCKHIYRCCPLYRMNFIFCIKVSCELCHTLCIFLSLFFFILTVVFVTANPMQYYVATNGIYLTKTYSNTQFKSLYGEPNDIIIAEHEQSMDILTDIINYPQTFKYTQTQHSYFRPQSVQDIKDIIIRNNNSKIIRIMGAARSSNYVFVDDNSGILIDFSTYPYAPYIEGEVVVVNTSMKIADLNRFLYVNGYVLHGFTGADEITIGGALGSCSFGPLYGGKSLGYYVVSASVVDGLGVEREFDVNDSITGVRYLDGVRCNLGVLGVVHQVKIKIFALTFVRRIEYKYNKMSSVNESDIIGQELFFNAYSDDLLWILWQEIGDNKSYVYDDDINYNFEQDVFNTLLTPISCLLPSTFDMAIQHFMRYGRYYDVGDISPVTYSINKAEYYVQRYGYIVHVNVCMDAVFDAKQLANELVSEMRMLPIGVTYINGGNTLLGYENNNNMDLCQIEIQISSCSRSRYSFAERFERIIVGKYNGSGHWGYLWFNDDLYGYKQNHKKQLEEFSILRYDLDPNGIFLNKLYANMFTESDNQIESQLITVIYPRNYLINVWSFYVIFGWFLFMFCVYLIGTYLRILPFLEINNIRDQYNMCKCTCCDDMNELDELIQQEQKLLEQYGYDNNFDVVVEDLIDVEVLDPVINDYVTITVTFRTAFLILMGDMNYREWKYRETFAVSRNEELFERFLRLGQELTWKSIYPRQCLFFSSCTLSIAMILIAIIQASLS